MSVTDLNTWTSEFYTTNVSTCELILQNADLRQIPCLNSSSLDQLRHGQLVKFRGMIQDMYDPEYYFKQYLIRNKDTGESEIHSGMYIDSAKCSNDESECIEMDSEQNAISERHTCVVVSIPGLNDWAREKPSPSVEEPSAASGDLAKRELNKDEPMETCELKQKEQKSESAESSSSSEKAANFLSREHIMNFPIPMDDGKACIVKVYDEKVSYKLNEVVNIVGFLSLDPTLGKIQDSDDTNSAAEIRTHNPPPFLVPRLHAIRITAEIPSSLHPMAATIFSEAESVRSDLHTVLSQFLFGDSLAADYLICHLVSSVYLRKDDLCLGSFPLNVTNFPSAKCKTFAKDLYRVISSLVPKSHYLEMTLDQLNDMNFIPKKDYECNRLTSGILQLSKNTHLVIDETSLTSGQVSAMGKKNYEAISDVIKFQKLNYDFTYFSTEYETDIPVLILSEVKSFIPCSTQIPLKFDEKAKNLYPSVVEAANQYLRDEERLSKLRNYLQVVRHTEFEFGAEITDVIQEDFVRLRQSTKNFGADNLHSLMVLARLMSLSRGKNSLSLDCWKETVRMELQRMERLPQHQKK